MYNLTDITLPDSETESDDEVLKINTRDQDEGQAGPNLVITTTTIPPPPQPQQSTADPILMKHIDELEQHMVNLLQYNLALKERLDKHGSRLYKLENLNIPYQVSKAVDEIVTDAVDWAMQALLRARFSDLPAIWRKLVRRKERCVTYQELLLGRHRHNHHLHLLQQAHLVLQQGSKALSSSKSTASAPQSMAWTTSNTRDESAGLYKTQELSLTDSLILYDSILDEQVHLSDDEDSKNDHLPTADSRKGWWKPLPTEERPATPEPTWTSPSSNKGSSPALSISKMKAASYPNFGLELLMPEQIWIEDVCTYDISVKYGISHWWFNRQKLYIDRHDSLSRCKEVRLHMRILNVVRIKAYSRYGYDYLSEIVLQRADLQEHSIVEKDFKNLHLSDFEDLNLLLLRVSVNNYEQKIMRFNEIYKFSNGTLTWILEALAYRVKEFKIKRLNPGMNTRFWTQKDVARSKEFIAAIERRLKTRRIYWNLECFIGG
nr:hypothetical protein [Tanacetum cinerariifolium]